MTAPLTLKNPLTPHETEPFKRAPRVVPHFAAGALDAWATALMEDLGCGTEAEFHEWLGTPEGAEMLRLTYSFSGRLVMKRAAK